MADRLKRYIEAEFDKTRQNFERMAADASLRDGIVQAVGICVAALRDGKKILFAGNGGSAADAQHWAGELVSRFNFDRPGLAAVALTTDSSAMTAISNDYGYEQVFSRQVQALGAPGDVLVAISTSGRSLNILAAIDAAREKQMRVIGFSGATGGDMRAGCELCFCVPCADTPRIQEGHEFIGHVLCALIEQEMFGDAAAEEAIVLVGGLGTRLRSELGELPKPLAPVAGRPFLAWLLDQLAARGIRRVILATGYGSEQVEVAIGRGWQGMEIAYSVEDAPLGTGGALAQAAGLLHGAQAHLMNGDTFLRFDLAGLERSVSDSGAALGIALAQVPEVSRYGAVEVERGRVQRFREKGGQGAGWINAGSYFLTAEALAACPATPVFSFEEAVLRPLVDAGRVAAYLDTSEFIDIGVPEDYRLAQLRFAASA